MTTEAWFRNPHIYAREIAEAMAPNIAWDMGILVKQGIDPHSHAELYFSHLDYRLLVVGNNSQGAAELRRDYPEDSPFAVYPVWEYGEDLEVLETLLEHPAGEDPEAYEDDSRPDQWRAVEGQPHRIIVTNLPRVNQGAGRRILRTLKELQEEHPDAIIHIHGLYGYRPAFGMGWRAADVEPRMSASKGKVILPNGKEMKYERAAEFGQWLSLLGFSVGDLSVPRNRCIYNIKSAMWAAEHYDENIKFRTTKNDLSTPGEKAVETKSYRGKAKPNEDNGDKMLCNTCSIQSSCKYFREGAVCSVPGSRPAGLAKMFGTRDSDQIIAGLNSLLASQSRRYESGLEDEELTGELDPEVTKIANSIFTHGVKLAKLINPQLADKGTQVGVFVNAQGAQSVGSANPKALVTAMVAELESQGIPRDKITPEMIQNLLSGQTEDNRNAAIAAGEVLDVGNEEQHATEVEHEAM